MILTEDETLDIALAGRSISRVGEGELKFTLNKWDLKSQDYRPKLAEEIRRVLSVPSPALACLPRYLKTMPNEPFWRRFETQAYRDLRGLSTYGSAFISRPDVATNIDRPDYWAKVAKLWASKDVTLAGPSLKVLPMPEAASVRLVEVPVVQAYDEIDRIEEEIGEPAGPVLLVIGATATALADRLARKGLWAMDMGHLGMFMGAAGSYSLDRDALISPAYLAQNRELHAREKFGVSGKKSCADVMAFASEIAGFGLLDYGCGRGTLKAALVAAGFKGPVEEYDPAIKGRDSLPKPADLVTATDVLEHVEPEKLDAVLAHIRRLSLKGAFFVIATRKAKKTLGDGRNAHLLVKPAEWWLARLSASGFVIDRTEENPGHDLKVWCR